MKDFYLFFGPPIVIALFLIAVSIFTANADKRRRGSENE